MNIARTQYKDRYWLRWTTGHSTEVSKNDIQVILENERGESLGDAVCHNFSYGNEQGLWEIAIDVLPKNLGDTVQGYLTFEQVLKYFDKKIKQL